MKAARAGGTVLLLFLLAAATLAGDRKVMRVKGALLYKAYDPIVLSAQDVTSAKAQFLWDVDGTAQVIEAGEKLYIWAAPGSYTVKLTAIDFDNKKIERARFTFTVEGKAPDPGPGPGPDPGPGPKPPNGGPAPIPLPGLRVLVVYASAELPKLPPAQSAIIFSKAFRDWCNQNCVMGADGKTKEWRIWDKDVDSSQEGKHWGDALKRGQKSLPWLVVSNGKNGWEGPLPANVQATLDVLKKYATATSQSKKGKR